jgi:hypothetical protein
MVYYYKKSHFTNVLFMKIEFSKEVVLPVLPFSYSPPILYKYFCVLSITEFLKIAGVAQIPESI